MAKCDCFHQEYGRSVCWGTREKDECSCGGDRFKCTFYPEIRKKSRRKMTENTLYAINEKLSPNADKATLSDSDSVGENRWVSVKDKLPTETGLYLVNVHQENDTESGDCVLEAWYRADRPLFAPDRIGWTLLNEFYQFSDTMRNDITHWMPWPEPPKI